MTPRFALVLDGWSISDSHFLGMVATFPTRERSDNGLIGYGRILLAFSSLEAESSLNADEYISFMQFVSEIFEKSIKRVIVLIADFSTKKPFIQN